MIKNYIKIYYIILYIMSKDYNTKYYLELYRQEYEEYMGSSSFDNSMKLFTEEEQIIRYSKHLGFWLMKFDLIHLNKPSDYKSHSLFLLQNIAKTNDSINQMFPTDVKDIIKNMARGARDIHKQIITGSLIQ